MSHRAFRDSSSVEWEVWEVRPTLLDRPVFDRRAEPRDGAPRTEEWLLPKAGMSQGWLLFESSTEKRRLVPIPEDWSEMSEEQLELLCGQATPVRARASR